MEVRERLYRVDIIKLLGFCFLFFVWKKCERSYQELSERSQSSRQFYLQSLSFVVKV